ncbi:MAG: hypothetical protein ACPG5B_17785 [Chitinophagales bacterium]
MRATLLKKHHFLKIIAICLILSLSYACNRGGDATTENSNTTKTETTKTTEAGDLPAHCNNGLYDGDETGIDCGGSCPTDCCNNKKFDANLGEKGTDCGGKCPTSCCENGILDATNGETDIDCGGPCKPCKKEKIVGTPKEKTSPKATSPLAKDLEKDLNELSKQGDKKQRRKIAKDLNKKYKGAQIVVVGKETKTYSIRDYTKNLNMLIGNKIKIKVTNVQEADGKVSVASITEKK